MHKFVDHQLVKPITLREAIDKCELVVGRLLSEKKSIGMYIDAFMMHHLVFCFISNITMHKYK